MPRYLQRPINRRELLRNGCLLGSGLALGTSLCAGETPALSLITKPIPSSGEQLPVVGLGTIWFRDAQYEALRAEIARFSELGGTLLDTAAAYGESEGVIGRAVADLGLRKRLFLATKFDAGGTMPMAQAPGAPAASAAPLPGPPQGVVRPGRDGVGGLESFERSLVRLKTDQIDLLQVHSLNGTATLLPQMLAWKQAGRIRYIGVTTSSVAQHGDLIEVMRTYPLDFIQVDYSLGNREAETGVFPEALKRKVAVLANLPLGRATLLAQAAQQPLPAWAADIDVTSWSQFLLKYVVSHSAVTCAIPGSLKLEHVVDNMAAGRGRLPDVAMRRRMEALWESLPS
ncbi:MAG: aldo/keto reductase [Steroidobacteraceae bacterium]|jgi:diketogulonate reductase-like aldo/keto reductase